MSSYELDDDLVREAMTQSPKSHAARDLVFSALERQLPVPMPTKPAAVVQTVDGVFCLSDPCSEIRWRECTNGADGRWCDNVDLPRIAEVLFEGVDI